ncbi:AraC family transcriptional regulator [Cohnella nanjingensis]|uniref:AraC family transcriptional regulator n=1 Tax=Cohnella nanjingensis TaxID=1387779 RepID=A0A7X0VFZ0_9BACL|nr:AraC family transcriptional regulator [Cohnella nanjingensis]MBB6672562.1 AraC family transcriptional regulator [Cohnella nanjingensis]
MPRVPTYRVASSPAAMESRGLNVLFAGESQTRPHHRVGPKVVDYYLLHHVLSGRGRFRAGDAERELRAGHTFLIHPQQLFSYASDGEDPWRYRWVAFSGEPAAALLAEAGLGGDRAVADTGASRLPADSCRSIYEAFRSRRGAAALEAAGHLHLLLAGLREASAEEAPATPRPHSHDEELVRQVIAHLSTQYAEPVTIEAMAETLGYNRAYLSRLFKRQAGLTPIAFLTRLRIDHGRRLLRERPELTVEQIASSVGFHDALYFSKQFRKAYGQTPTDYRVSVLQG